jgi:hypothetical protein
MGNIINIMQIVWALAPNLASVYARGYPSNIHIAVAITASNIERTKTGTYSSMFLKLSNVNPPSLAVKA